MIVTTESGSRYEIDRQHRRARKIMGGHTEMTDGGGWRRYLSYFGAYEGSQYLLIEWDAPGKFTGNRGTKTSRVVAVEWPE
jgi:hypothetical protein